MEKTSDKLEPVCLVLKSELYTPLLDLMKQLDNHVKNLELIQVGLQDIDVNPRTSDKNLHGVISGERMHDGDLEQPNSRVVNKPRFRDQNYDEDNPYAEIDTLRRQVLKKRTELSSGGSVSLVPGPESGARPQSMFAPPGPVGLTNNVTMTTTAATTKTTGLYERVEELIPSPFADRDLVCLTSDRLVGGLHAGGW